MIDPENLVNAVIPEPMNGFPPNFTGALLIIGSRFGYFVKVIRSKVKVSHIHDPENIVNESLDPETSFLVWGYIFRTYRPSSYVKVIGSRSRLHGQQGQPVMTQKIL